MSRSNSNSSKATTIKNIENTDVKFWVDEFFPAGFVLDRPYGSRNRSLLFLHFRSDVMLETDKDERLVPAGACIFFSPTAPQKFTARENGLSFDGLQLSQKWVSDLNRFGLPLNEVFFPNSTDFIPFHINRIKKSNDKKELYWKDANHNYISLLLILLAQQLPSDSKLYPEELDAKLTAALRSVCMNILNNPAYNWKIEEIADSIHLSRSRFSTLFKIFCGHSPKNYLINTRLKHSIILLTNTPLNVTEIAAQSGFPNPYYYSRIFHKRVGCAPSDYNDRFIISE